jgi:hypothetical protein
VEPLYREALDILDHAGPGVPESDTALALELEALALKELGQRVLDDAPLKERALRIRAGIIRDVAELPWRLQVMNIGWSVRSKWGSRRR